MFCFLFPVYPTPLISVRFRESVFRETGHTIMNLLAVSVETPPAGVVNSSEDTHTCSLAVECVLSALNSTLIP